MAPLIWIRNILLVPLTSPLQDQEVNSLQESILEEIGRKSAKGLVIDISSLPFVDSYLAQVIMDTAHMAGWMGAKAAVVGMKPEIALSLTQMGFQWTGVKAFLSLDEALRDLEQSNHGK